MCNNPNSPKWTRSSFCSDGACLEVAYLGKGRIAIRDSKRPDQQYLTFGRDDWHAFLDVVKVKAYLSD